MTASDSLLDPKVLECPYPFYDQLRAVGPVIEVPEIGYVVTSYELVKEVLLSPDRFSNAYTSGFGAVGLTLGEIPESVQEILAQGDPGTKALIWADDPAHRRQRQLVVQAFNPRRVTQLSASIHAIATELIDRFIDRGEAELLADFGIPLPLMVVADALGVSRDDLDKFDRWTRAIIRPVGQTVPEDEFVQLAHQYLEFQAYFTEQIDARKLEPRDDLLTDMVRAEADGEDPLTRSEVLDVIVQLIVAGNETTANAIIMGMAMLLARPDLLQRLRDDPSLCAPFADEVLRLESPVQGVARVVRHDTELGGVPLPEGSRVMIMYGAANRDSAAFACPGEIDLRRPGNKHLAFAGGIHLCIGSSLAREEMRISFQQLLGRLTDIRVAEGHVDAFKPSIVVRGIERLPLTFRRS